MTLAQGRWRAIWCLLALSWCDQAPAQDLAETGALYRDDFASDAGVDDSNVLQLRFDAKGMLWVATSDGLLRYDGFSWTRYGIDDGLPSRLVRSICPLRNGDLWVGTDAGAGVFDGRSFDRRDAAEELRGHSVRRIVEDPQGTLWFCCDHWPDAEARGGLFARSDSGWQRYGSSDGLPSDYVSDYVVLRDGRRFVLTGHGLAEMRGNSFRRPLVEAGLSRAGDYVWSLVEDSGGDLFATGRGVVFHHTAGTWRQLDVHGPGPRGASTPVKLWRLAEGTLATYNSSLEDRVMRWSRGAFEPWSGPLAGSDTSVEDLVEGPDGALWIGGVRLLTRWQPRAPEWSLFPDLGAPQFVDAAKHLWFTKPESSSFLAGERVQPVGLGGPLALCGSGVLGRVGDGLAFWRDNSLHPIALAELGLDRVALWVAGPDGEAWVAGVDANGQAALRRQAGLVWNVVDGLPPGFAVTAVLREAGDAVSVVLRRGNEVAAVLIRSGQSTMLRLPSTPLTAPSHRVFLDGDDTWLIGGHRMRRLRTDGTWDLVEGLPGDTVTAAFRSAADLWFACEGTLGGAAGLVRYDGRSWQPVDLPGTHLIGVGHVHYLGAAGPTITVFPADAPPHVVALPIAERGRRAVRDVRGALWIHTARGPLRWLPDGVPPKTVASVNSTGISERDVASLSVDARRHLRPRHRNGSLQAAYRIGGGDWSPFQVVDARPMEVGLLPVGSHTVEVVVRDEAGVVDPHPVSIPIEVFATPLQQRWWFWGLVAMALGFLGLFAGVTYRSKALSRALQARLSAELRYRIVIEHSPLGILEIDGAGTILTINAAGANMLFATTVEAVGASLSEFVEPADQGQLTRALGRDGANFEFVTTSGRQIEATLRSLGGAGGPPDRFVANLKDVTSARQLEASARHGQRMEAIGRLAGGIAHDFNNLLTAVLGNTELLRQQLNDALQDHPSAQELLGEVEIAGRRAADLTRQLLTFARRGQSTPEVVDVKASLREVKTLLERIVAAEVHLHIEDERGPATVRLGQGQIEQIVLNLVTNAAEAMGNRGVVRVRLWCTRLDAPDVARFGTLSAGSYVVVAVADQGGGIAGEVLPHLFEPFFTTKGLGKGTGLGLATVHGIVQGAGGRIDVATQFGVGSEFMVWLPFAGGGVPLAAPSPAEPIKGSATVLVCDDQRLVRSTVANMLEGLGYTVLVATNAAEALELASTHVGTIDLLLTDVTMPDCTGPELAKRFAALRRDARVIFMTGYEATAVDALETVLAKPFTVHELAAMVRAVLP